MRPPVQRYKPNQELQLKTINGDEFYVPVQLDNYDMLQLNKSLADSNERVETMNAINIPNAPVHVNKVANARHIGGKSTNSPANPQGKNFRFIQSIKISSFSQS